MRTLLQSLCVAAIVGIGCPARASSYRAMSSVEMTVHAEVVAVGVVKKSSGAHGGPAQFSPTEVLKGRGPKRGAWSIATNPMGMGESSVRTNGEKVVLFLKRDKHGALYPMNYSNSVRANTARIGKVIRDTLVVVGNPGRHLQRGDRLAVEALLEWIAMTGAGTKKGKATAGVLPWPIARKDVLQFLRRATATKSVFSNPRRVDERDLGTRALEILVPLRDAKAAPVFVRALGQGHQRIALAAQGLRLLHHRPAAGPLAAALPRVKDNHRACRKVAVALAELGGKKAVAPLVEALRHRRSCVDVIARQLGALGDPRALAPVLELMWRDNLAPDAAAALADTPTLKLARRRLFDHPMAPALLAHRGDPTVRGFMHRLIRQENPLGLIWAAGNLDAATMRLVLDVMVDAERGFAVRAAMLLKSKKHPRIAGAIAPLLLTIYRANVLPQLETLLGISPQGSDDNRLRAVVFALLARQRQVHLRPDVARRLRESTSLAQVKPVWLRTIATPKQLLRHKRQLLVLWSSAKLAANDRQTALRVMALSATPLFSAKELGAMLSVASSKFEQQAITDLAATWKRKLPAAALLQVTPWIRWHYATQWAERDPATCPCHLLVQALKSPKGAANQWVHRALRLSKPAGAIAPLKKLLGKEHIDVRREAAITLAHWGDKSGKAILEQEVARFGRMTHKHHRSGTEAARALRLLEQSTQSGQR